MVVTRSQTKLVQSATDNQEPPSGNVSRHVQIVQGPGESEAATSREHETNPAAAAPVAGPSYARSTSSRTSRSSATVTARKLAAEAQHGRHLAQLELEFAAKKMELERRTAELEYQAELAAIDEPSEHGSVSSRRRNSVKQWVQTTASHTAMPEVCNDTFNVLPYNYQIGKPTAGSAGTGEFNNNTITQSGPTNTANYLQIPLPNLNMNDMMNITSVSAAEQPTTSQRNNYRDICEAADCTAPVNFCCHDGVDNVSRLLNTFQSLVNKVEPNSNKRNKYKINLPTYDGKSPMDWLVFKRSYIDSNKSFSAAENVARLSAALTGLARDAVCMLLATAPEPDIIIAELDRRFGRPEQIVLREVAAIRALPRITGDLKDLATFAARVRNCVEVVKLLNETDYLRSPELFSALINKLHPLLRTRWLDYAAAQVSAAAPSNSAKVELLSQFLSREVDLHIKFDSPADVPHVQRERTHATSESEPGSYCLHLQLYRDPKDRFKKGQTKASLSLQQFLGFESGFTLDKESNTIAIICQDVIVVLAFETRERLIAWQVKVGSQLGQSKEWLVMIGGGSRKLPAGPARLHLQGRRFALASGVPPRLLGLWELAHLRRYGVVEGRFCFEGGSHCGKGEGLHVLITDQAQDITDGFDAATHGNPRAPASRKSGGADRNRPDTRLSDLNAEQSIPDTGLYEENFFGEDCEGVSPFWPSDERRGFDDHDCKGCEESNTRPPWSGADHVTLERCSNCVTKLGAMTRSSTVALTPGTQFNPAWTMEPVPESSSDNSSNSTEYLTPRAIKKSLEASQHKEWAPQRPPKPARLEETKAPAPLPVASCTCSSDRSSSNANNPKVGPYENYDVPKATHIEVESANEYYDTPKRIKRALADDLFQVANNSVPGNLVLKKNCGCILKFGSKKKPVIVECDENIQPVECPCQKVTNWANNLISLPYCKRSVNYDKVNTEVLTSQKSEEMALYATVDVSRKTNRQSSIAEKDSMHDCNETPLMNYENLGPKSEMEFEDPYANYENLEFALSLEYYENAKDLLKKAGVTQKELDALSANVDFADVALPPKPKHCAKCGHSAKHQAMKKNKSDEYLLMEPTKDIKRDLCRTTGPNPGYTPMSPNPNWSQSLRHPLQKLHRVEIEKSLSIPTLNGGANRTQSFELTSSNNNKEAIQKRSSSVDSARLLEDLKEFDSSIGSHATSSSLETLRNLAIENRRSASPCDNERDCCDHDCCKSSDSENKTSEGSVSKDMPHLRNKHMDNAQIKRSSSVPCKSGGNRDSSSSNDSGVSSCSMKHGPEFNEFEMPLTSGHSRYQYMAQRRMRGNATGCIHSSLPRKSKSSDLLRDTTMQIHKANVPAKSSSAEAEVPVLPPKQFKGVMDTHSTSSGTSDMSDYIETLSLTSSHSSSDNPNLRLARQPTTTLRPRSGKEYHNLDPIITSMYKSGKELSNYTNLP